MKTTSNKSALVSAMVFFFYLYFVPSFIRSIKNVYNGLICGLIYTTFVGIGIIFMLYLNCDYVTINILIALLFVLIFPLLSMFAISAKLERILFI